MREKFDIRPPAATPTAECVDWDLALSSLYQVSQQRLGQSDSAAEHRSKKWLEIGTCYNFSILFFFPLLQLYELSDDAKRKEFLDDLFAFMQKRGKLFFLNHHLDAML